MDVEAQAQSPLFDALPVFPVARPDDELRMLASLPEWPTNMQIEEEDHPTARRLEKLGLIKVSRQKMDPVSHWPDWFAGKLPSASLSEVPA